MSALVERVAEFITRNDHTECEGLELEADTRLTSFVVKLDTARAGTYVNNKIH